MLTVEKPTIFAISPWPMQAYQEKQKGFKDSSEHRILKGLVDRGHSVHLLVPKESGVPKQFSYSGILIHEFKVFSIRQQNLFISKLMWRLAIYFMLVFLSVKHFMGVMKVYGKPDIVYGCGTHGSVAAYISSRFSRMPNITRLYGTLYPCLFNKSFLFARCFEEFIAFKLPCKYFIITDYGSRVDEAARIFKIPPGKVKFWKNGVDFSNDVNIVDVKRLEKVLQIPEESCVIVSISRLASWKGIDRLIRAMPPIASKNKGVKVLIIGEGEEREKLEKLTATLNLEKHVNFLGAIPHEDIKTFLHASDIFVSLQDYSNLSSSLFEAMACGVCVIALNSGATGNVIKNKQNGILVNYNDLQNLPSIIDHLINDEKLRNRLGDNAKQYALKNLKTWDERVAMEVELIESMIADSKRDDFFLYDGNYPSDWID
jgi:glycosyltransferase involved in cell wall biosynthesis